MRWSSISRGLRSAILAGATAFTLAAGAYAVGTPSAAYQITTVAEGLDHPWSIAFLPDGAMLVTERAGQLRVIRDGNLEAEPVAGVPETYVAGQGGLFDVVLHPRFAANGLIYLSYANGTPGANTTRVARARFDGSALQDLEVIFDTSPTKDTAVHYGGRMAFLPDGTLLLTLGDGFDYREQAQVLSNHLGTIVRINDDGTVPPDNPFVGRDDVKPEIWTYGHRSVQGIVIDRATGRVYSHEHGPRGGDELNLIEPGKNYGWPVITYGVDYSGAIISPFTEKEGMEQPLIDWTPSIAPAGLEIYTGSKFPAWTGDLFAAALAFKEVRRVDMENGAVAGQETLFKELDERIRDVRQSPDGSLYLLTDSPEGRVLRVDPAG